MELHKIFASNDTSWVFPVALVSFIFNVLFKFIRLLELFLGLLFSFFLSNTFVPQSAALKTSESNEILTRAADATCINQAEKVERDMIERKQKRDWPKRNTLQAR